METSFVNNLYELTISSEMDKLKFENRKLRETIAEITAKAETSHNRAIEAEQKQIEYKLERDSLDQVNCSLRSALRKNGLLNGVVEDDGTKCLKMWMTHENHQLQLSLNDLEAARRQLHERIVILEATREGSTSREEGKRISEEVNQLGGLSARVASSMRRNAEEQAKNIQLRLFPDGSAPLWSKKIISKTQQWKSKLIGQE